MQWNDCRVWIRMAKPGFQTRCRCKLGSGIQAVAGAGALFLFGVYQPNDPLLRIGLAMNKILATKMVNCNQRRYIQRFVELKRNTGRFFALPRWREWTRRFDDVTCCHPGN